MKTKVWFIENASDESEKLKEASLLLQQGELVAFPTETVYGIGADATNPEAVRKIFKAKGRPSDNPLIVHIFSQVQLEALAENVPPKAGVLMEKFWPGSLTLIFAKTEAVPREVSGGLDTVAVRMPDHRLALALLKKTNLALAAPSANTSGKPSPTSAEDVLEDLDGKIAGIIDGGKTTIGLESTVLDLTVEPPLILRPGAVTEEMITEVIGRVGILNKDWKDEEDETPKSLNCILFS